MKESLAALLKTALTQLQNLGELPAELTFDPQLERTRDRQFGDYASNIAMELAKAARQNPRQLASRIVATLPPSELLLKVEVAGPGFINFHLATARQHAVIDQILAQGAGFGRSSLGSGQRVQVEFVSANPNGPLHVGHGRGAAYGAAVASLFAACGFEVTREYYLNDAGRQMDILSISLWLRYLELLGEAIPFPSNGYRGDYVIDIARLLQAEVGKDWHQRANTLFDGLPPDEPAGGDKEAHVDALIERAKQLLGADYGRLFDFGLTHIQREIAADLAEFGVHHDQWFSERSLTDSGEVEAALALLQRQGLLYEAEGALWFRSTRFGDDKDRVVRRENGVHTYFASDIAYHHNKFQRGFDRIVNVWGSDHHGYIARVKAAIAGLGHDPDRLTVQLVQFVILYRGSERVQMSTRSGSFTTLRELRSEVGNDAARFFYVTRKSDQHMDFDLDLAKSQSKDNPVYYIQYAHARIASMVRKLAEQGEACDDIATAEQLTLLSETREQQLVAELARYPEVIEQAALQCDPHLLAHYLRDLASHFHIYYNGHRVLVEERALRTARIALCRAVQQVIANGLGLLGVAAPSTM
jgi:arginyl-tRNA synthetase